MIKYRDLTDGMSTELKVILIVALEHFLLLLAWIIHKAIPDRPSWVRIALARNDYESKLALKREVSGHAAFQLVDVCWFLSIWGVLKVIFTTLIKNNVNQSKTRNFIIYL